MGIQHETTTKAFPFFRLPRELRDDIYEYCDGPQEIRLTGEPVEGPRAYVEHGLRTNLLLVCKQFRTEYWMRQRGKGKFVLDAASDTSTQVLSTFEERVSKARRMRLVSGPKLMQNAELKTTWVMSYGGRNCMVHATMFEALAFQLRSLSHIAASVKVYMVRGSGSYPAPATFAEFSGRP